jgi:tetratricopeptide (TPR) repeat protein
MRSQKSTPSFDSPPLKGERWVSSHAGKGLWKMLISYFSSINFAYISALPHKWGRIKGGGCLLFFLVGLTFASEQGQLYIAQANQAYEEGEFTEAQQLYEKAINEGVVNANVYYNYANTLFRLDKLGESILYYEKALKLSPTDEDIKANLKFANAQTIDKHPQPGHNIITKFIWFLHSSYDLNSALWLALGLFSGLFLLGVLVLFIPQRIRILIYPLMGLMALGFLITIPSIAVRIHEQETVKFGIVLAQSLEIYSGPGESYQVLSKVHEGTKFEIEGVSNNWAKVKLPNGTGGYVKYSELGSI